MGDGFGLGDFFDPGFAAGDSQAVGDTIVPSSSGDFNQSFGTDPFGTGIQSGLSEFGIAPSTQFGGSQPTAWDQIMQLFGGTGGGQQSQQAGRPGQAQSPGMLSQALGFGLPATGTAAGLIGIIQSLAGGRPVTSQQVRSSVQQSPQQAQLTGQTLQSLQGLQGLAQNAELQQAVSRLASGQLPISPDLVKQVTNAFGAAAGNLAQGSVEDARSRGFSGGLDLLTGAGAPRYGQQLGNLQSDVSQALINLALGLPTAASNIQSQQVGNAATGVQGQLGLLGQLQQFAGLQGGSNTQTLGPRPNLLSALQPLGQLSQGLGQMGAGRQFFQPQGQQQGLSGVNPTLAG